MDAIGNLKKELVHEIMVPGFGEKMYAHLAQDDDGYLDVEVGPLQNGCAGPCFTWHPFATGT
jgi:hypothetical protein